MAERVRVTGMWQSNNGPIKASITPDVVANLRMGLKAYPDGQLVIWPNREVEGKKPTHSLCIEPKFVGGGTVSKSAAVSDDEPF